MAVCSYCKEKTKRKSMIMAWVNGKRKTFTGVCDDCYEFIDFHNQNGQELPN